MRKTILMMSIILLITFFLFTSSTKAAQGWVSDTGFLSLKIGEECVKGIPTQVGYIYTITYDKWVTKFIPMNIQGAIKLGWKPLVLINGELLPITRLGNGWLFSFKEKETKQ